MDKKPKKKIGRPSLEEGVIKDKVLRLRFSTKELESLRFLSKIKKKPVATLIREALESQLKLGLSLMSNINKDKKICGMSRLKL